MRVGTIDVNKLRFVADKGLGLGKELMGVLVSNDRLQQEGESQRERANTAQLRALRSEIEAQRQETKADMLEKRQRAAQQAK